MASHGITSTPCFSQLIQKLKGEMSLTHTERMVTSSEVYFVYLGQESMQ
jgi:hypothetical protein